MRPVAILCPGPSLERTWGDDSYDRFEAVIAVNRAATHRLGCDWWQAHDGWTFESYAKTARVRRGVCTWPQVWSSHARLLRGLLFIDADTLPDAGFRYHCLTMLGAMGMAVHLGALEVVLFGVDWIDPAYRTDPGDHHDWAKHREYYAACCAAWPQTRFRGAL